MKTAHILLAACLLSTTANAATVLLDTTTISWSASGNSQNVMGPWSAFALVIPSATTVDYFTVEVTDLKSNVSAFNVISFKSYMYQNELTLSFCPNPLSCVAPLSLGTTTTIAGDTQVRGAWDFLNRLVQGPSGTVAGTVEAFTGSGNFSGTVVVNAYGDVATAPVPVPAAVWLLGSGLLGLIDVARRKAA